MKLKSLKVESRLTVKQLRDKLNELDEKFDDVPVYCHQSDSDGSSVGSPAVLSYFFDSEGEDDDMISSFEIEVAHCAAHDESEEGLTPDMVFKAHLGDKDSNVIPKLGYANLSLEDQVKVDEMIEEYNKNIV